MTPILTMDEMALYAEACDALPRGERRCKTCAAVLSRRNTGPCCWPCTERQALEDDSPTVPRLKAGRQYWTPENVGLREERDRLFREEVLAVLKPRAVFSIIEVADVVRCHPNRARVVILHLEREGVIRRRTLHRPWRDGRRMPFEFVWVERERLHG